MKLNTGTVILYRTFPFSFSFIYFFLYLCEKERYIEVTRQTMPLSRVEDGRLRQQHVHGKGCRRSCRRSFISGNRVTVLYEGHRDKNNSKKGGTTKAIRRHRCFRLLHQRGRGLIVSTTHKLPIHVYRCCGTSATFDP